MINPDELRICAKRGHDAPGRGIDGWAQCKWCGMWLRGVYTTEEREDEPPKAELSVLEQMRRLKVPE